MTPFYSTMIFPLSQVNLHELRARGWKVGPAFAWAKPFDVEGRVSAFGQDAIIGALLSEDRRVHRHTRVQADHLVAVAYEVVGVSTDWSTVAGYLIVHVAPREDAREITALTELGQLARPGTRSSRALLSDLEGESETGTSAWTLDDRRRVPVLSLSGVPCSEDAGLVRWPGSAPTERRLADLVVLRKDKGETDRPFVPDCTMPTPSHLLAGSELSVAIIRLRRVRKDHVTRLRTQWCDAFLQEVIRADEIRAAMTTVQRLAEERHRRTWQRVADDFRQWRTADVLLVGTDHPMEAAIAQTIRRETRTKELVEQLGAEISDHTTALSQRVNDRLTVAILLLTIATVLVPMALHLAGQGGSEWGDPYFLVAGIASIGLLLAIGVLIRRR